jgi:asparagine synthase (glutamine-hydrolysing)
MPGIFGFIKKNQTASIKTVQKAMTLYPSFKQDDLFEDELVAASRVHLGKIGEKTSPKEKKGVFVWIEGEVYNLSDLSDTFGYAADTDLSTALLINYENNQLDSFLNQLDGYFCAVIYDTNKAQVKLISDRYGMRMLYWYMSDGQFAWASEVKGILALDDIDKTIDPTSFDCFMDLGHLLGEHTWFDKIKLIKPATVLTLNLSEGNITQHHYWTWAEIKPSLISFDKAVDELGKYFIKAVKRRFNPSEKIGVTLSGGLDSRVIFAVVEHLYPDYKGHAFTFGIEGCDDITIAKQVVAKSSWNHKEYHFTDGNWFKPRLEKIWNTDGMQDMMHMHGGEFIVDIASKIDVNLNGYAGDAIFGGSFLNQTPLNERSSKYSTANFYKNFSALADVDDAFYEIDKVEPNLQMNRVRRFTAMGTVNALVALEQRKPFFDNDCVELIYSLPDEYRLNNKLYAAMLHKFFPKFFKNIPWQQTGKPAGLIVKKSIPTRAFNKIARHLKAFFGIKTISGYTDYNAWIRSEEVAEYLTRLLNIDTAEYKKLTSKNLSEKYLKPHLNIKLIDKSNQVLRAATVEVYLRKVADKNLPS